MKSPATGDVELTYFRNKSLSARGWFWIFSVLCMLWISSKLFQRTAVEHLLFVRHRAYLRDTQVKKPSRRLLVVQETGRAKSLLWVRIAMGVQRRESPVLQVKVWAGSWKIRGIYFCREGKVFQWEGVARTQPWNCDGDVTGPGNHEYIPKGGT